jgi:hypothetical protein
MTARKRRSLLTTFYFVATLGLMVGGSLWLDQRSDTVLATVSGKTEEIQFSYVPQGAWYRFHRVGVTFTTADGRPGMATIGATRERFDALHQGDTLSIRYLAGLPLIARSADRSTATVVRELVARILSDHILMPLLLWIGGGFILLLLAARVSTSAIFVAGALWTAVGFPLLLPAPERVTLPATETEARVTGVSLVERAPERRTTRRRTHGGSSIRRLAVPYQVVQLRLAVPGLADSVLAVDAVDSGSTAGLVFGAILPVRYDPDSPREARLVQGTRTFMARNRYHFLVPVVGVGALGTLGAWGWRRRRARYRCGSS